MKPCIPNANQSNQALRIDLLIEQTPFPFDAGRPTSHIVDLGWLGPFQISPVRVITQNICHPKVQELGCGGVIQTGMSHACYFRPCIKCILQRACHCPKNVQQPHETIHHWSAAEFAIAIFSMTPALRDHQSLSTFPGFAVLGLPVQVLKSSVHQAKRHELRKNMQTSFFLADQAWHTRYYSKLHQVASVDLCQPLTTSFGTHHSLDACENWTLGQVAFLLLLEFESPENPKSSQGQSRRSFSIVACHHHMVLEWFQPLTQHIVFQKMH